MRLENNNLEEAIFLLKKDMEKMSGQSLRLNEEAEKIKIYPMTQ